ncbi:Pyridoxine/pyridoxamine 5'-phosphate oxidase [Frankliniella fusca]|uniref:pyridoxal 5'-phosphate synthase n=1 Tax=Frankliniella fusca TaxID=407009 RepID=A0AAE1HDU7_9NEOP|nr:Pyridoxine/pyridoxamine 5'-phosphate oxidase [Frankliniella fusca]
MPEPNGIAQAGVPHTNGVNGTKPEDRVAVLKAAAAREESGLSKIELIDDNPFTLFREWHTAALQSNLVLPNALCLSTATKEGRVSSRHVILRRLEDDGFIIMTDRRSKKSAELVRIEGDVVELTEDQYLDLYEREPLFCKVRSHLCHQGVEVDWDDLKKKHDEIVRKVAEGTQTLPCPEHFVAYKLYPTMIEFYYAHDSNIGDRIMFLKKAGGAWEHTRIAA